MPASSHYEYSESLTAGLKQKKKKKDIKNPGGGGVSRKKGLIFSPQIFDRCAEDIPGIFSFSLLLSASLALKRERKRKGKGKNQNFQKLSLLSMRSPFWKGKTHFLHDELYDKNFVAGVE